MLVVCGLVRDRGKGLEAELWKRWGGNPTLHRLRWRGREDDRALKRLHDRVSALVGFQLPTKTEEANSPSDSDQRYEEAIAALREITRDTKRFQVLFEENVEYGFRRNSLGIRPVALAVSGVVLLVGIGMLLFGQGNSASNLTRWGISLFVSVATLGYWYLVVTEAWVRRSGERYADRLFGAIASLRQER